MFFQNNILDKYIAALPHDEVAEAWGKYKNYFLDTQIQENIRHSKEEQFQEGFLRELFVKVALYISIPTFN